MLSLMPSSEAIVLFALPRCTSRNNASSRGRERPALAVEPLRRQRAQRQEGTAGPDLTRRMISSTKSSGVLRGGIKPRARCSKAFADQLRAVLLT